jgi:hypothetical protein
MSMTEGPTEPFLIAMSTVLSPTWSCPLFPLIDTDPFRLAADQSLFRRARPRIIAHGTSASSEGLKVTAL